jgi:hypothetical protein
MDRPPLPIPGVNVRTCPPVRMPVPFLMERGGDLLIARPPWNLPTAWSPRLLNGDPTCRICIMFTFLRMSSSCCLVHSHPILRDQSIGALPVAQRRDRWTKQLFKAMFERECPNDTAFLQATTEQDVQSLQCHGVTHRTVLVPNGIDVDSLRTIFDETMHNRLDEPFRDDEYSCISRAAKGLDLLLRACADCPQRDSALVVVGPHRRGRSARSRGARELDRNQSCCWCSHDQLLERARSISFDRPTCSCFPSGVKPEFRFPSWRRAAVERPCLQSAPEPG